jgi:hypothetical protein
LDTTLTLFAGALIRLAAMAIGAFLCFLGYRLFSEVPLATQGDAELSGLKGTTIKLTRIGPGVFFALFGALTVIWAISQPFSYSERRTDAQGAIEERTAGAASPTAPPPTDPGSAARPMILQEIRWLNQVQTVLTDAQRADLVDDPDYIVPGIKRRLMLTVWDSDIWGNASAFVQWLDETGGIGSPADPKTAVAADIFAEMP